MRKKQKEDALKEDDLGIYSGRALEAELEEDEIEPWEEAFMQGWVEA